MLMLKSWLQNSQLRAFAYSLTFCLTGGLSQSANAAFDPVNDDTDIFLANPNLPASRPNVLLYVDNTANWNQPFVNEKSALVNVVNGLDDSFNLGLMLMAETGTPNDNQKGSYIRFAIRQMTAANKSVLTSIVNNFDQGDDVGNGNKVSLGMVEAYRYFSGGAEFAGNVKSKTDYANNVTFKACASCGLTTHPATAASLGGYALNSNADGALYNSPIDPTGCAQNYLIYISNGAVNEANDTLTDSQTALVAAGYGGGTITISGNNGQEGNWMDEWALFMANADINGAGTGTPHVFTYTLEINPTTSAGAGGGLATTALMQSVAENGKGAYFSASDANGGAEIETALKSIFSQIQAVNSVFAAVTLPVSVNVRGTNLNQVYIGVFRPDANKKPRWFGNLKMYQLGFNTTTNNLFLADVNGNNTENPTTGFLIPTAVSFWTASSNFWGFRPTNQNGAGGASDLQDGDLVEKGGAAQQLRLKYNADGDPDQPPFTTAPDEDTPQAARSLYTCTTGCVDGASLSDTPFDEDNTDLNETTLALSTNNVVGLTAFASKSISSLTDTRSVTSAQTTVLPSAKPITLKSGMPISVNITNLTNSVPQALTLITNTNSEFTITDIARGTGGNQNKATVTYTVAACPAIASGTVYISDVSNATGFNGTWTASSPTCTVPTATFQISQTGNFAQSNSNPDPGTMRARTTTTTFTATVPNHGYGAGQGISLSGSYTDVFDATVSLVGTYSIATVIADEVDDATPPNDTGLLSDKFTFTGTAGSPAVSVSSNVSGSTTTATATAASHPFLTGDHVTIAGATPDGYNVVNATVTKTGDDTFTYTVPTGLGTTTTGTITATKLINNPDVTATSTDIGHGFSVGVTTFGVNIVGASDANYNGSFDIFATSPTVFTYTLSSSGYVPIVEDDTATASLSAATNSTTVTAIIPNHKFLPFDGTYGVTTVSVVIAGDTSGCGVYNGTVTATIEGANTITYPTVGGVLPCGVLTPLQPATGTLTAHLATKTAFATVANFNFINGTGVAVDETGVDGAFDTTAGNEFPITIKGATPESYNGTFTATVVDTTTFKYTYTLVGDDTQPLGAATGGAMSANLKTTTATATVIAHGYVDGDALTAIPETTTATITGATPSDFNRTSVTITYVAGDPDKFTYPLLTAQGDGTGNILVSLDGAVAAATIAALVNWVRGRDNLEDENDDTFLTDARSSIHGDVLHSRPAVVNYNRHGNDNDVYIYYGANDGVFRAIKGGSAQSDVSEPLPGEEAWGFIPKELFSKLKRVRNNSPLISSTDKKPYFMDGSLGVYVNDANIDGQLVATDGDKVHIYISTHRGGRFIYALDVSDPLDPKLLWSHANTDAGWAELGETWSVPQVHTLNWSAVNSNHPVLIFGAGYDPTVEDVDTETITAVNSTTGAVTANSIVYPRTMGRGIFVVDAITGDIIWSAGPSGTANATAAAADHTYLAVSDMIYAIPSDIAVIADSGHVIRNRGYVGDTGGNVWRIDMFDEDEANWTVTKLASVRDDSGLPGDPSGLRKFLFPPDVVHDESGFDAVLIGSGDREHPFEDTVINRMYMFKDTASITPSVSDLTESDLFDATSNCIQECTDAAQTAAITALANADGWYVTLGTGEKSVGNAVTLNGVTFFNTNQPTAGFNTDNPLNPINVGGVCGSDLGVARQYQIRYDSAVAVIDQNNDGDTTNADRAAIHPGGGYLPSPVPLVVVINGVVHEGVLSGTAVSDPPGSVLGARLRKFWYKEFE